MIEIVCHRGYWLDKKEGNNIAAFRRAFSLDLGIETDIRDYKGEIVISHDIATKDSLRLENLLGLYRDYHQHSVLFLNIKTDGLQNSLRGTLKKYKINNYFVFDMSLPEQLVYARYDFKIFARQSEFEKEPLLYQQARGIWLDEFNTHWIKGKIIKKHIKNKKEVCIVSPELHQRDYHKEWKEYRILDKKLKLEKLFLCTDFPEKAKEFFNG
jgi:glycerophosphoryl diester phosphodiesterase